ncbi:hypothetical protein SGCOL_011183 [Colletotrichum sp. CLE4]
MNPREFKLLGEERSFQACVIHPATSVFSTVAHNSGRRQIHDDGFKHSLMVYRDIATGGVRLQASVWDGELKQCPVWTAFVTHQSASPTWLVRKSDHRVWLKDVQLFVFCEVYHQQHQRKGKAGAFEIDFFSEMGASQFIRELQPRPDPSEASTDSMEAIEDSK